MSYTCYIRHFRKLCVEYLASLSDGIPCRYPSNDEDFFPDCCDAVAGTRETQISHLDQVLLSILENFP